MRERLSNWLILVLMVEGVLVLTLILVITVSRLLER